MRKRRWLATVLCAFLLWVASCGRQSGAPLDALVDVGTHRLHIHCLGAGRPTVVLDTGADETYEGWVPLIESLEQDTRVCAYERAGYGQSDPGPMPRDSQRAADELHLLLLKSRQEGPFLLVGHSLGALNLQVYAAAYPEEVAGLVLLDPPPREWLVGESYSEFRELFRQEAAAKRSLADAAHASGKPEERTQADFLLAVASEYEELFGKSAEQVAAISSFANLPVVVVGATAPNPGASGESFRLFWNRESQQLAEKSDGGRFILAEGSSHHIHVDSPDLVLQVVRQMLAEIRG